MRRWLDSTHPSGMYFPDRIRVAVITAPYMTRTSHDSAVSSSQFHKIRLHAHDLVFAVPVAGEEVLDSVGFEPHWAVDELGLFGAGVVPGRDCCF